MTIALFVHDNRSSDAGSTADVEAEHGGDGSASSMNGRGDGGAGGGLLPAHDVRRRDDAAVVGGAALGGVAARRRRSGCPVDAAGVHFQGQKPKISQHSLLGNTLS